MKDKEKTGNLFSRLKYHSWILGLLWTGCIVASLLWNLYAQREKILKIAHNSAQLTFEKDIIYRRWAAKQGGVYVHVSEHTPPNPYLRVPDRDIATPSGLLLTLVNPAYMTRQVNQMAADIHGSQSHLTSLNPIRPENMADPWETVALKSFERGIKEVSSVEKIAGEEYLRLMRPFVTEKACLKCHASQGYKEGDIRGGISVSIPMAPLWAIERPLIAGISLAHLLLWMVGIGGIVISKRGLEKEILARQEAEAVLSESAKKLRIVADFTYDWEYWRSPDNRFLYVSPSCERITGYTREEFILDPELYSRIIHPDDRERVAFHLREDQFRRELCELEFRIVHRDGRERWIGHACQPVLDAHGQSLGRRASDRDITERKQAEIGLADRTIQLERMNRDLVALNADLDEFTHMASHDLQEPLRTLSSFSDLLGKDLGQSLPERAARDLGFITDAAKRMQTLIHDLLALSRAGRVAEKMERVSLTGCADLALEALALRVKETGAKISRDALPDIWGDSTLLTQLYQNLIGNALKFIGDQRPIIQLTFEERDGDQIFGVKDNGIGIDPKYAQEIFKPFKRLHGFAEYEGSGIGLAICRKIVDRHGGKIWVESESGEGAHFRFTILHRMTKR
jgi:chemotaxis family two-component system sensor kinase Cph1